MNLNGQPASVGRHCGGSSYVAAREIVDFYADALDDRSELYRSYAPPLLYHSECFKFLAEWYLRNLIGNLHARQEWFLFAPIPIGAAVRTRSTIIDRYDKRGRDYVVNETDVTDADSGALLVRGRTHQSFLQEEKRDGFVVDERSPRDKRPRPPFPTATGEDLAPVGKLVDQRRCWMFSGPGRNYHTDAEEARNLGFPTIVVQGMMTTCFIAELMLSRFGTGFLAGGRMDLKLTNVLWVDRRVSARGKVRSQSREGAGTRVHCDVWVEGDDGTRISIGDASALV
jgi:acyl dehydratase